MLAEPLHSLASTLIVLRVIPTSTIAPLAAAPAAPTIAIEQALDGGVPVASVKEEAHDPPEESFRPRGCQLASSGKNGQHEASGHDGNIGDETLPYPSHGAAQEQNH
jgi:hypothetical protein